MLEEHGLPPNGSGIREEGGDTVGNPRRARISRFELFELALWFRSDRRLPVEQFEAAVHTIRAQSPY